MSTDVYTAVLVYSDAIERVQIRETVSRGVFVDGAVILPCTSADGESISLLLNLEP